ncbi:MAG: site-2 protease family protein [Ruminococcaceae bacterium]|nr:site-2 protease family protein [Oscillospiraceae bacterium]
MSHGFAAFFLGDRTAKSMGRLSLNPLRHVDPIGALCLLFFGFGWAKPVMINPAYFKNPKRDTALTALAGPVSNFIMAYIALLMIKLLTLTPLWFTGGVFMRVLLSFLTTVVMMNIGLGTFNLIPIPPLDGSKIFLSLLPPRLYYDIMRYEHLGWVILVVALSLGVLDPIIGRVGNWIFMLLTFLAGGL